MSILRRMERRDGIRHLYMDLGKGDLRPHRGDYVQTVTKKKTPSLYRILVARLVQRRDPFAPPRYMLTTRKVYMIPDRFYGQIFYFRWYKRVKGLRQRTP